MRCLVYLKLSSFLPFSPFSSPKTQGVSENEKEKETKYTRGEVEMKKKTMLKALRFCYWIFVCFILGLSVCDVVCGYDLRDFIVFVMIDTIYAYTLYQMLKEGMKEESGVNA